MDCGGSCYSAPRPSAAVKQQQHPHGPMSLWLDQAQGRAQQHPRDQPGRVVGSSLGTRRQRATAANRQLTNWIWPRSGGQRDGMGCGERSDSDSDSEAALAAQQQQQFARPQSARVVEPGVGLDGSSSSSTGGTSREFGRGAHRLAEGVTYRTSVLSVIAATAIAP